MVEFTLPFLKKGTTLRVSYRSGFFSKTTCMFEVIENRGSVLVGTFDIVGIKYFGTLTANMVNFDGKPRKLVAVHRATTKRLK